MKKTRTQVIRLPRMNRKTRAVGLIVAALGFLSSLFSLLGAFRVSMSVLAVIAAVTCLLVLLNRITLGQTRTLHREALKALTAQNELLAEAVRETNRSLELSRQASYQESHRLLGRVEYLSRQLNEHSLRYFATLEPGDKVDVGAGSLEQNGMQANEQ